SVLVTSLSRRAWGDDGKIHSTLGPYVDVVRAIAKEKEVPLIDLHARSIQLYERLGRAEVNAMSPRKAASSDDPSQKGKTETAHRHLTPGGGAAVGKLVAEELAKAVPQLAPYVKAASARAAPPAEAPPPAAAPLATVDVWPEGKMPGRGAREPEVEIARGDGF